MSEGCMWTLISDKFGNNASVQGRFRNFFFSISFFSFFFSLKIYLVFFFFLVSFRIFAQASPARI